MDFCRNNDTASIKLPKKTNHKQQQNPDENHIPKHNHLQTRLPDLNLPPFAQNMGGVGRGRGVKEELRTRYLSQL